MEDFILKQNTSLLNSDSFTYLHPGTSTTSAIDLSLYHPSLYILMSHGQFIRIFVVVITTQSSFDQMFLKTEMHWIVGSFIKQTEMLRQTLVAKRLQLTPLLL